MPIRTNPPAQVQLSDDTRVAERPLAAGQGGPAPAEPDTDVRSAGEGALGSPRYQIGCGKAGLCFMPDLYRALASSRSN